MADLLGMLASLPAPRLVVTREYSGKTLDGTIGRRTVGEQIGSEVVVLPRRRSQRCR